MQLYQHTKDTLLGEVLNEVVLLHLRMNDPGMSGNLRSANIKCEFNSLRIIEHSEMCELMLAEFMR